jgi:hypothetical protein
MPAGSKVITNTQRGYVPTSHHVVQNGTRRRADASRLDQPEHGITAALNALTLPGADTQCVAPRLKMLATIKTTFETG